MTDSMVPSFLVVNPDGTIGADFTGRIHAQGLDLDEAPAGAALGDKHKIRWLDANGVERMSLWAENDSGIHRLYVNPGPSTPILIDSNLGSSWMRKAVADVADLPRTIAYGKKTAPTNGQNSATVNVPHGIGVTPDEAYAVPIASGNAIADVDTMGPVNLVVRVSHRDAASLLAANVDFYWLAIG